MQESPVDTPANPLTLSSSGNPLAVFQYCVTDYNHPIITLPGILISAKITSPHLKKLIKASSMALVSHTDLYKTIETRDGIVIPPFPYTVGVLGVIRRKEETRKALQVDIECIHRARLKTLLYEKIFTCNDWEMLPEEHPPPDLFAATYFQERLEHIRKFFDGFINTLDPLAAGVFGFVPSDIRGIMPTQNTLGVYLDQCTHFLNAFSRLERVMKFLRSYLIEPNVLCRMVLLTEFFNEMGQEEVSEFTEGHKDAAKPKKQGGSVSAHSTEYEKYSQQYLQIKAHLPVEVQEKIEAALERFQKEEKNQDTKTHLVYLLKLFSLEETRDNTDIIHARAVLDRDHTGLERPKERVLGYIAERVYAKTSKDMLCIVGPTGVGKTSIGTSVAEALNKKFVRFSVGGLRDEAEIKGHGFTYIHTEPGQIAKNLIKAGSKNPVFLIDEIDKMGRDMRGDPTAALLELFDAEQNHSFFDRSLDVPFDCSRIFFICTANTIKSIPPPLLNRMEVIKLSGYTPYEKLAIAKNHLIPKILREKGFPLPQGGGKPWFTLSFSDDGILRMIENYTSESGVRQLERIIGSIARRVILRFQEGVYGNLNGIHMNDQNLDLYAGKPLFYPEQSFETLPPGCVPMFAVSETGGHFFYVEMSIQHGHEQRKIKVTGIRGSEIPQDVSNLIEESVHVAFDSLTFEGGILCEEFKQFAHEKDIRIHVHVRESAIPKDGPSAGIPMLAAIYGLLRNKSIQPHFGATGEIDLRLGRIGAVGGIREKALAAYRAGIKKFIIPEDNALDLDEVPEEIKQGIEFLPKRYTLDALLEMFPDDELLLLAKQKNV